MPGSKRRALKKLLKNEGSGSESSTLSPAVPANGASELEDAGVSEPESIPQSPRSVKSPTLKDAPSSPDSSSKGMLNGGGGMPGANLWGRPSNGGGKKKSSKQRFAERQARKAQAVLDAAPPSDPSWNAQLEKERLEEVEVLANACDVLAREIFEIQPDGHCMFSAVADQLGQLGVLSDEKVGRRPRSC